MPQESDGVQGVTSKDGSIKVKASTINTLQKQSTKQNAETQTQHLDKDDSYEAYVLQGGPWKSTSTRQQAPLRFYINGAARQRQNKTLSERFLSLADDDSDLNLLLGEWATTYCSLSLFLPLEDIVAKNILHETRE